jgi:hypothetical protein
VCTNLNADREGGIRVPAFIVGPGVPPGLESHQLIAHIDILPTLVGRAAAAAGHPPSSQPLPLDGVDQWGALTATGSAAAARTELLHNYDLSTRRVKGFYGALRMGTFKLVRTDTRVDDSRGRGGVDDVECGGGGEGALGIGEGASLSADGARKDAADTVALGELAAPQYDSLFNVVDDPSETIDLAGQAAYAETLARLRGRMDELSAQVVPCWCDLSSPVPGECAGVGYTGDCDAQPGHCQMASPPDHYGPGWCTEPPRQ